MKDVSPWLIREPLERISSVNESIICDIFIRFKYEAIIVRNGTIDGYKVSGINGVELFESKRKTGLGVLGEIKKFLTLIFVRKYCIQPSSISSGLNVLPENTLIVLSMSWYLPFQVYYTISGRTFSSRFCETI